MDWHHAPLHRLGEAGAYIVTGATYQKDLLFATRKRLEMLQEVFFAMATKYSWETQSWSLFPNHYHFIAYSEQNRSRSETSSMTFIRPVAASSTG
jgi:REP element-mobilizing transposase RayT